MITSIVTYITSNYTSLEVMNMLSHVLNTLKELETVMDVKEKKVHTYSQMSNALIAVQNLKPAKANPWIIK